MNASYVGIHALENCCRRKDVMIKWFFLDGKYIADVRRGKEIYNLEIVQEIDGYWTWEILIGNSLVADCHNSQDYPFCPFSGEVNFVNYKTSCLAKHAAIRKLNLLEPYWKDQRYS